MRLVLGFILSCLLLTDIAVARDVRLIDAPTQKLIGGRAVNRAQLFPEVVQLIVLNGRGLCTGTVVGPEVVLTAGHCVQRDGDQITVELSDRRTRLQATCERSPFITQGVDHDVALCKLERAVSIPRFPLIKGRVKVGSAVTMMGLGCINRNQSGGNDGTLRIGAARVNAAPDEAQRIFDFRVQSQTVALCPGDSGGPSMQLLRDPTRERHLILGVNSKVTVNNGQITDTSLFAATFTSASLDFFGDFATQNGVKICGVNDQC